MRAFSLSAIFGFKIEQKTLRWIKLNKDKLSGVSSERVRDELFKILDRPDSVEYLLMLDKLKILRLIIPEIEVMRGVSQGPYHHLNVLNHSFETVTQLEGVIRQKCKNAKIKSYLDEVISGERKRRSLLKFAALLHDIGKPRAKRRKAGKTMFHGHEGIGAAISLNIARRLKLANDEIGALRKMIFWHLRPGYLADNEQITARAKFRYFRDTADEGVSILLLSIADQRATKGRLTSQSSRLHHEKVTAGLIKEYFKRKKQKISPRLLTGDDLIKEFKLEPGPLIGRILSQIEELQAIGRIKTKAEALTISRRIISKALVG
ncbi:MAG: HD domain-containing protein [Candidatus Omnitrophota bacterium]